MLRNSIRRPIDTDRLAAHERRNLRLCRTKQFRGFGLRLATLLEELVDLDCELRLQQFLLGIPEIEIGKHIAAAPIPHPCASAWRSA
jgi:hypothetical protein